MSVAYANYRLRIRAPFIIGGGFVAIVGYIVLITSKTVGGKYTAVFLCAGGIYPALAILLAWPSENLMGQTFRATALAMVISLGNCGAIIGTQLYRVPLGNIANKGYRVSYGLTIVWLFFGIASASLLWFGLARENRKLLELRRGKEDSASLSDSESGHGNGQFRRRFLYQI